MAEKCLILALSNKNTVVTVLITVILNNETNYFEVIPPVALQADNEKLTSDE